MHDVPRNRHGPMKWQCDGRVLGLIAARSELELFFSGVRACTHAEGMRREGI